MELSLFIEWSVLKCAPGEFECEDGSCIPGNLRCDGYQNCPSANDEDGCSKWHMVLVKKMTCVEKIT